MIFNVLGSCVSRDIFRFSKTNSVDINIQRNPISTLDTFELEVNKELEESIKLPNYEKRMLLSNMKRDALGILHESNAEWLIIDLSEERYSNCFIKKDNSPLGGGVYILQYK